MEQAASQRRLTECTHAAGSCTLAEDGHVVGVAAKLDYVGLYPFQRLYLVQYAIVTTDMVWTLGRKFRIGHKAEDAQTVVDGDEHHVLRGPFLTVELWFRAPALAIAAAMNPQRHGQFLISLGRCLRPNIEIEAVLAIGSLIAITPFRGIETRIVDWLIAWMTELITQTHGVPCLYWLRLLPAQVTNRRCCVGYSPKHIHTRILSADTLYLTALNGQHRTLRILLLSSTAHQQCHDGHQ